MEIGWLVFFAILLTGLIVCAVVMAVNHEEVTNNPVNKKSLEITRLVCEEFRNGEITYRKLDPHGISSLGVKYNNNLIVISWFCGGIIDGRFYDLRVNGGSFFGSSDEARLILKAARSRAEGLFAEELNRFHKIISKGS